jgi:hypothetical protein
VQYDKVGLCGQKGYDGGGRRKRGGEKDRRKVEREEK